MPVEPLEGMRAKHPILIATVALALACVIWVALSLQDDDSTLSVVVGHVRQKLGWSEDSTAVGVLKKMTEYEKKGRYDDAVSIGVAWAEKYPDSFMSGWIYRDISTMYLKRARQDSGRAEAYLTDTLRYRDKALPSASDSPYSLQPLEAISESVGDLSAAQRCVQYRNAVKLLDRMGLLISEDRDRLARQLRPNPAEHKQVECLSEWVATTTRRVKAKLPTSGCK
jgi:hypothetical protein